MSKLVTLRKEVDKKISELQDKAIKLYGVMVNPIDIRYDLNTVALGGVAICNANKPAMRLHPAALVKYGKEYINDTVVHEYAHLLTHRIAPRAKAHGAEWRAVMVALGAAPNRCHNFDLGVALAEMGKPVKSRVAKSYAYKCDCDTHNLTAIRHNRCLKGAKYVCKVCNSVLVPA